MAHRLAATLAGLALVVVLAGTVACGDGGSTAAGLDGTRWRLTGWSLNSLNPSDFTIEAVFSGGQVSGKSAVNTYGGPYETGPGDKFSVGDLASTMMAGPEPAMRAETAYMKLLQEAGSYKVSGTTLTLYDKNGNESLIYTKALPLP